jgi:hypothetical protein
MNAAWNESRLANRAEKCQPEFGAGRVASKEYSNRVGEDGQDQRFESSFYPDHPVHPCQFLL